MPFLTRKTQKKPAGRQRTNLGHYSLLSFEFTINTLIPFLFWAAQIFFNNNNL